MTLQPSRKLVLVLGGGGVRGLAHLGILRVFERAGIRVDGIVGTSAGAIVGALYAREADAQHAIDRVLSFLESPGFRRLDLRFDLEGRGGGQPPSVVRRFVRGLKKQLAMELLFRRPSMFRGTVLERLVSALLRDGRIEDLALPLHVTALDLVRGEEVVLSSGDLVRSVVASSSVPGFFPPVALDGRLLCDAGLVDNMPIGAARMLGADVVVAVSLNNRVEPMSEFPTGIDVIFRAEEIGTKLVNDRQRAHADVLVEPDLGGRYWLDFADCPSIIDAGARAAEAALPSLLSRLGVSEAG